MFSNDLSPLARRLRTIAVVVLALLAAFALLFVSTSPSVDVTARPTAGDIAAARDVWQQLENTRGHEDAAPVRIDDAAIRGVGALANDATGLARVEGRIDRGTLLGNVSIALPAGLWINASATASGEHKRFPAFSLKIGRVRFPELISRWIAEFGRWVLRLNGADIPPLDEMVQRVDVGRNAIMAQLSLPKDSGAMGGLIAAGGKSVNDVLLRETYCRLSARQREVPARDLSALVRETFSKPHTIASEEYNRAAFVALSLLVVGDPAVSLSTQSAELVRVCPRPTEPVLLQGRSDLAMHWTLSAGLTAVLGGEAASSLGEWKELNDSLADGSGFSFVDLAADRSGMNAAMRALDSATLARAMGELARATDDDLLPHALLQTPEGLTDAAFVDRFGALDNTRYRRAVASIDQILAQRQPNGG